NSELVLPLTRACFPGFAAIRQGGGDSAKAFLRIVGVMMLLSLPAGIGLALVAAPLIRLGFGAQWMAAVPVMRILALAGILGVFASIGSTLLSAHAHLRPLFLLSLGSVVVKLPLLIFLGERDGIVGVALAVGVTTIGEHLVNIGIVIRRYRISLAALVGAVWRPVLATAAMAAVLGLAGLGLSAPAAPAGPLAAELFAAVALGALVYGAALFALWGVCGRPAGAELDVLDLAARMFGRLRALLPRLSAARR
ncbi:MAG: polysaccharide biosynthesis C-terminal domain-containing protein, partial [Acetobacteraceae bacterium]